jgi:hypothetical protein
VKKVPYIASMLLVALSTAGAMVVGQSFAAQSDKAPCTDTSKPQAMSDQSSELQRFFEELQHAD